MQSDLALAAEPVELLSRSQITYKKIAKKPGCGKTRSRIGKTMTGILAGKVTFGKPITLFLKSCHQFSNTVSNDVQRTYKQGGKIFIETISSIYEVLDYTPAASN